MNVPRGLCAARSGTRHQVLVLAFDIPPDDAMSTLTAAERDVALGMLRGESNAEIASRRGCSARTVANQAASLFRKLGVSSRGELASRAIG
jgi:DNA-binding CsgD family transcriptional regulator